MLIYYKHDFCFMLKTFVLLQFLLVPSQLFFASVNFAFLTEFLKGKQDEKQKKE